MKCVVCGQNGAKKETPFDDSPLCKKCKRLKDYENIKRIRNDGIAIGMDENELPKLPKLF